MTAELKVSVSNDRIQVGEDVELLVFTAVDLNANDSPSGLYLYLIQVICRDQHGRLHLNRLLKHACFNSFGFSSDETASRPTYREQRIAIPNLLEGEYVVHSHLFVVAPESLQEVSLGKSVLSLTVT